MSREIFRIAVSLSCMLALSAVVFDSTSAHARPPRRKAAPVAAKGGNDKAQVTALVADFEAAYKRKDKNTMITKLMTPNPNDLMKEKRFQWLRGYGPKDMPGSKHPPILFERPRGTFVPASYTLRSVSPGDSTHYTASVEERGMYVDEDGKYKITRIRQLKCAKVGGKWYIEDYPAPSEDDLGFGVDSIVDKSDPPIK